MEFFHIIKQNIAFCTCIKENLPIICFNKAGKSPVWGKIFIPCGIIVYDSNFYLTFPDNWGGRIYFQYTA